MRRDNATENRLVPILAVHREWERLIIAGIADNVQGGFYFQVTCSALAMRASAG